MPTYEYECGGCGHNVEYFQSIREAPTKKCPQCGKLRLKRLLGCGSGLIFRGSGFYITDYRSSDYAARAKAESGDGAGGAKEAKEAKEGKGGKGGKEPNEAKEAKGVKEKSSPETSSPSGDGRSSSKSRKPEK